MNNILHTVPFLRILIGYAVGIVIAEPYGISFHHFLIILFPIILMACLLFKSKTSFINNQIIACLFTIFLIGMGHYRYQEYNKKPSFISGDTFCATLLEKPIEKVNSFKVELLLTYVGKNDSIFPTNEKLIAYMEKGSSIKNLEAGTQIIFKSYPNFISNTGNPFEFDYQTYLARKKIYRQVYIKSNKWKIISSKSTFSPTLIASKIREKLISIYRNNNIVGEEFAILSALTLGYKDALGPDVKTVFSSAGAMHVLAVSGLHVGIIYLVVNLLFKFIKTSRRGRILFICISISSLWIYALITGLSPSVQRAATMFSIVIIGENLRRPTNIYNTLASSALLLLVLNPNLLFEVGFQLSYSAVLGIVFFQPKIYKILKFKYWLSDKIWVLVSVSIAAQLTTVPFTLYYFNQYPAYSIVSSLIVIPAAFILMFLGIALISFSWFPFACKLLALITSISLRGVFISLKSISELPGSVIQNINISTFQFLMLALSVVIIMLFFNSKRTRYFMVFIAFMILMAGAGLFNSFKCCYQKKIIVYNVQENTIIQLINGKYNYVISDISIQEDYYSSEMINNVTTKLNLKKPIYIIGSEYFENRHLLLDSQFLSFCGKNIVLNEKIIKNTESFITDIVILKGKFDAYILNTKHLITWNKTLNKNQEYLNIHSLRNEGAFILEL